MARRSPDRDSGVTAVEFAILLPFFVVLIFGIIEFGQVLFVQAALQHAVTHAARCASEFGKANALGATNTPPDCSSSANVQIVAVQQAYGLALPQSIFTPNLASGGSNCVTASYPFALGVPFLPKQTLNLTAQSCYPAAPS